ncbi:hypothetical protein GpartN1_g880.t1 [Galdieria partita]|uniref:Uncharacterized protein n=1 Tax=Galdieria partita TaxID=83374 RepID=A0A9C7PRE6_9RHOD|nr:hypothetical protein GpartN1_g880.t1 [Galdieria partita]
MERDDRESSPQEKSTLQTDMECYKEQMKEIHKRLNSLFQSEEHLRNRLQKVANEAEDIKQNCLSDRKWQGSHSCRGKENSVDAEYTKEIVSKLLGEMNKLRAYWMQEMQLRHCCQNELFEYKQWVAGMDVSSSRTSEELEYYREQATRYKQALLSTTKWCIEAMNETEQKMQKMVKGYNKLEDIEATNERIQVKLKVLRGRNNKEQRRRDERLQRDVLNSNNQLSEKLAEIRNEIHLLNKELHLIENNTTTQRHEEWKQWLQGMKQEIQDQIKGIAQMMDKGTSTNQENIKLLENLKHIGLQLQTIGDKMVMENGNGKRITQEQTNSNETTYNFRLIKWSHTESLQPNCCALSIDKLCNTTTVSIPPQMDANLFSTESEANELQHINKSSTWKVFKIQSTRRIGATHTSFQENQDSIYKTTHNDTTTVLPTAVNIPTPKSSNNSKQAFNRNRTKSSKKQAAYSKSNVNVLTKGNKGKNTASVLPRQGSWNILTKKQSPKATDHNNVNNHSAQEDGVSETLQTNDIKEQEASQGYLARSSLPLQPRLEADEQGTSPTSHNNQSISRNEQEASKLVEEKTTPKQRIQGKQQIARSSKCFGKKRKSFIIDEYELTAETCSQTLPLSFFENLQI